MINFAQTSKMAKGSFSSINYSFLNRDLNPTFFRKFIYSQDEVSEVFCLKKNEAIDLSAVKKLKQKSIFNNQSQQKSIFTGHLLNIKSTKNTFYEKPHFGWISITFILLFCIFAFVQASNFKKVHQFIQSFFGIRFLNQILREGNFYKERITYPLLFISFTSTALFFYGIVNFQSNDSFFILEIIPFLKILFLIFFLFIIKLLVIKFSGILFKVDKDESDYTSSVFLFSMFSGIFLLPVSICFWYVPNTFFEFFGLGILLIMFGFRIIRSFFFSTNESKFSLYYLFLYLCTVEIVPLFVLIKLTFIFKN